MSILTTLVGPIANLAKGYLSNKAEEKQAKHQAKMSIIQNDADWESKMADASKDSWKDEFWTIVLAIPVFMVGYAIAANDVTVIARVATGFEALEKLPEWYQYLLFIAISSSFGIRGASKIMDMRK
ncbi:hypothetical protein N9E37_03995 [Luminiphilus sp.]|jgi:hypothetical protein|nr:hypothetical protein [Luminiphilus sp.]|tara:strand:+ start:105 stop:482 length:378 start_codon:yes stop_codon:yes gene_type:complete